MRTSLLSAILFLFVSTAQAEQIAVVGGTVHTLGPNGVVENGVVLMSDGKIESVIADGDVPEGYKVIEAGGKIVTPGLMDAWTQLGLEEVQLSGGINDASSSGSDFGPSIDVSFALNPDSSIIPVTRIEGVTRAVSAPLRTGQLFVGRGAIIQLGLSEPFLVRPRAFMLVEMNEFAGWSLGGSRAALWARFENDLSEAKRTSAGSSASVEDDYFLPLRDRQALAPVVAGDMLLVIRVNRLADIRQVIALAEREPDLRIAILDGREAWRAADALAKADIPVILNPFSNLPGSFDSLGATQVNAARLHQAGVQIAITTGLSMESTRNARLVTQLAGNAVANGLPWEAALASLTSQPARIFGIDDRYGTLEPGKDADLVVWSGDPFEVMSAPEHVIIQGEEVPLVSRQTKLRDRYLGLNPEDKTFHYKR